VSVCAILNDSIIHGLDDAGFIGSLVSK